MFLGVIRDILIWNGSFSQKLDFKFPLSVSCVHFICSSIGAYVVIKVLKIKPLIVVEPEDRWRRIFPMSFVFCINIVLGNVSLRFIPVSFMQTIKSFTPATTGQAWNHKHLQVTFHIFWSSVFFSFHAIILSYLRWLDSFFAVASLEKIFWLANLGFFDTNCWRNTPNICYWA